LLAGAREDVVVSVITEAELRTGAAKSSTPSKILQLVENFLAPITLIEFTSGDAIAYPSVGAKFERAGAPIGSTRYAERRPGSRAQADACFEQ
jgi:predicted nucleic acid-binding protein